MRRLFLLKSVLAVAVLFSSCASGSLFAAEIAAQKDLQEAKAIEAYIQGGKFNFAEIQPDGTITEQLKSFADLGVGNISTAKYAKKAVPSWNGNSFSVTAEDTSSSGETVSISISGTLSDDRATLLEAIVKKTVKNGNGAIKSVEWTMKNITGGTLGKENYTNKRKVGFWKFNIPLNELQNHLVNVTFSETTGYGKKTTFVSIPSMEQIQARYGNDPYLDNYKQASLSFTFILDL